MSDSARSIIRIGDLTLRYRSVRALDALTLDIPRGRTVGLIGPDGVGKSSLLAIIAGARRIQSGWAEVLDGDIADPHHRALVCPRIAYMPQGLGKNLYPDLTVRENIEFFARLFGQSRTERGRRIDLLLQSTGLAPFHNRPAKNLSGGMRQKLGLCCSLVHDPDLLLLDEPTTGVDPLSRRQFWNLIARLRSSRPDMSVIVATGYMEEAEQFDWLVAMTDGRVLATGTPAEIKARTAATSIEEAFVALLQGRSIADHSKFNISPGRPDSQDMVITARELTCRFGEFTAVDSVNFTIGRGEIFGFLGPNGSGKTTTMKMLTGLLRPTSGEAFILGKSIDAAELALRKRVGYMAQSFSLYTELTVRQNLELHARLFQLQKERAKKRISELVRRFWLTDYLDQSTSTLPLGVRQRLSLAIAIVHEPDILILDEPTSGVDPVARDQFWEILVELSRSRGVTIFVSTHFMNEAMRCDRIALMNNGRVLATDAPEALIRERGVATLEDAFISFMKQADGALAPESGVDVLTASASDSHKQFPKTFSLGRMFAYSIREWLELLRDPIRLSFALLGTAFLMLIFGFGITTDVDRLSFAVLDRDQTPESRAYLAEFRGSRYFVEKPGIRDYIELDRRLRSGDVGVTIEIPPGFGRDVRAGRSVSVAAWIDGAMPFRAETIRGYLIGVHQHYLSELAILTSSLTETAPSQASTIETRFRYNQDFKSVYSMAPATMALMLVLIPAILMSLAIVREKELGSITNLYVTPVTRLEFLLGKQLPYVAIAFVNFALLFLMTTLVFHVPLKGSFTALSLGALLYVFATTGYGMLVSSFTRTQIAALFGTAILTMIPATQFSGMLTPVSTLTGAGYVIGHSYPMTYFLKISVGSFTKGLSFQDLAGNLAILLLFIFAFTILSLLLLRKQER